MKRPISEFLESRRIAGPRGVLAGSFVIQIRSSVVYCIVSEGGGWDHVSVSLATRTPKYDEMKRVKQLFFRDDETAMELHVSSADHVNSHPFCLHLWRPQTDEEIAIIRKEWLESGEKWPYGELRSPGVIPLPDPMMVGLKR